jgi:hypothetical protein
MFGVLRTCNACRTRSGRQLPGWTKDGFRVGSTAAAPGTALASFGLLLLSIGLTVANEALADMV